jgi:transcription initiation factor TFIIB
MVVDINLKILADDIKHDPDSIMQKPIACSLCKSENVITDPESGEVVCSECGAVISDKMEAQGDSGTRASYILRSGGQTAGGGRGMPGSLARSDMGLSTVMARSDRDAIGNKIDQSVRPMIERIRTWDYRTQIHGSSDRNLREAFDQLDNLKHKLALPDSVIEKAAYIYRKAQARKLVQGRSVSAILTAATYIACREVGIPETLKEIGVANNITHKLVAKAYRILVSELEIKIPTSDPVKCIVKVANKATIDEKTKRQAIDIMDDVTKREISAGKDPMGLAATVVYMSCIKAGEDRTQKDIAQAAGITDATLRNRFRDLMNKLELQ